MSDKKNSKGVTLKRSVTVKALVTPKFKEYMLYELEQAKAVSNNKLTELTKQGSSGGAKGKLDEEKGQLKKTIEDLNEKTSKVKELELDSHFVQGMVDGFVSVNVGDNLYEKLGAMEIIVKDGVVESVVPTGKLNLN